MAAEGMAEVSRGHSTGKPGRAEHAGQGSSGGFGDVMDQQSQQLAFDYQGTGAAWLTGDQGSQAAPAPSGTAALAQGLMEAVVAPENLRRARRRVKANGGSPGVDGMTVHELGPYWDEQGAAIVASLLEGSYQPQPVRRAEIPKPGGGVRAQGAPVGIPTVVDRFLQQAILQVLEPLYDPTFSEASYGYRPGRSAHQAIRAAQGHVAGGKGWVVDLDLEQFFDRVNHDLLLSRLAQRIGDRRLLRLIRRYLQAGVMCHGVVVERYEGTPQGGPLSPLLANILLDEFDRELTRRGHAFCRYADDCNIYVSSRRAGERVMASVSQWLERKLRLKVNLAKSGVDRPGRRTFLGFRLWGRQVRIGIAPRSLAAFKAELRKITQRRRGITLHQLIQEINQKSMGWVSYYAIAAAKSHCRELDGWLRRRLRCFIWKQWKTWRKRAQALCRAGVDRHLAYALCAGRRGPWSVSHHTALQQAVPNQYLAQQGYRSLYERFLALA